MGALFDPPVLNILVVKLCPMLMNASNEATDGTKTLSILDSYPRAKSRGVVVNHAGLWIHVVLNVDH